MENMESVLMELATLEKNPQTDKIPQPLDEYLAYVAQSGNALFAWTKVKPLFKRKLEIIIQEFQESYPTDNLPLQPNVDVFKFDQMKERIFEQLESYTGIPFTVQRLCELMVQPQKHYKRTDKFMRGLEKIMLVVSTIDPNPNVQKEEESSQTIVKQSYSNGSSCPSTGESPSKRIRLESAEPDNEPGPCDSADEMSTSVTPAAAINDTDQSNEAGPSTNTVTTQEAVANTANNSDDNMDIDTECSSSEAKLTLPAAEPSPAQDGVESSESSATAAEAAADNNDDTATTSEADREGGAEASGSGQDMMDAESSEVVSMEVEQSGDSDSSGVSTSEHGQQPAQAGLTADTDASGASSSGQDNVSTEQGTAATSAEDSSEAVPVDTEEQTEASKAATEEHSNTATDQQTVGHSDEVVDNVESSQDTQQSSSSSLSDISPGAADSSDQASSASVTAEKPTYAAVVSASSAGSAEPSASDSPAAAAPVEDAVDNVSQSEASGSDKPEEPSDDNSPDTSSTS